MSQEDEFDGNEEFGNDGQPRESKDIRLLRKKAESADTLKSEKQQVEQERDQARRELAMVRAGLDLDSPTGKLFAKAYDGETSVEAVKAAAAEYGLIEAPQPSPEELSQQQALQRLSTAAQGAAAPGAANSVITGADYASWDQQKRRTFLSQHPQAAEALKRGQNVPAIPGF